MRIFLYIVCYIKGTLDVKAEEDVHSDEFLTVNCFTHFILFSVAKSDPVFQITETKYNYLLFIIDALHVHDMKPQVFLI